MPISTIGSDGLASSSVTRPKIGYAGAVLQVVQTASNSQVSTTSTSFVTTSIAATITPSSASSKILVTVCICGTYAVTAACYFTVYRGGTNLAGGTNNLAQVYCNAANVLTNTNTTYLDSPATTSATTYTLYFSASSGTNILNYGGTSGYTTITLQEIAA
jgi:hypothetical protein